MKLNDLVRRIDHTGASDADITAITYDSRKAGPGALFVCLPGLHADAINVPGARYVHPGAVIPRPPEGATMQLSTAQVGFRVCVPQLPMQLICIIHTIASFFQENGL